MQSPTQFTGTCPMCGHSDTNTQLINTQSMKSFVRADTGASYGVVMTDKDEMTIAPKDRDGNPKGEPFKVVTVQAYEKSKKDAEALKKTPPLEGVKVPTS